jgi:hypothetical protein
LPGALAQLRRRIGHCHNAQIQFPRTQNTFLFLFRPPFVQSATNVFLEKAKRSRFMAGFDRWQEILPRLILDWH